MSYKNNTPAGSVYIGAVPWTKNYSNVVRFASADAQNEYFKDNLKLITDDLTAFNPNGSVRLPCSVSQLEGCNYLVYSMDKDFSGTVWHCFIDSWSLISPDTTTVNLTLDIWQQYHIKAKYNDCLLQRGHIEKSADIVGNYTQPEPFTVALNAEYKIGDILTVNDWAPQWVLHAASKYENNKYHYEGDGTNNTFGEYGFYINSASALKAIIDDYGRQSLDSILDKAGTNATTFWNNLTNWLNDLQDPDSHGTTTAGSDAYATVTNIAQLQDHRNELIGLYAIPSWAKTGSTPTNARTSQTQSLTLNDTTLANGYEPRNKKLLTSVCRAYALINRNGLKIGFKPELFNSKNITISLYAIPMSTSGYQYNVSNYADYNESWGEIPYSSERRVGYDQNTGLNKILSYVGAFENIAGAVGGAVTSVSSGNPVGIIKSSADLLQSGVSAIDQIGTKGANFGSNGDLLRITGGMAHPHFFEINPLINECRAVDDFFDRYGYTINRIRNIKSWITNRSRWVYLKTDDLTVQLNAPNDFALEFADIFNSGVTIWQNPDTFGDYSNPETNI